MYFLNDQLIEDSELICKKRRIFEAEDPSFSSGVFSIGGSHLLNYALVK